MPDAMRILATKVEDVASVLEAIDSKAQDLPLKEMAVFFHELKEQYERLDKARKRIYAVVDAYSKHHLPMKFDAAGLDMVRIPEIGRSFYPTTKYSAKVADREKLMAWLRENGEESLITETVNAGTLAAHLKTKMLDEGIEAPEDVAELTTYQTTGSSKYTPK